MHLAVNVSSPLTSSEFLHVYIVSSGLYSSMLPYPCWLLNKSRTTKKRPFEMCVVEEFSMVGREYGENRYKTKS